MKKWILIVAVFLVALCGFRQASGQAANKVISGPLQGVCRAYAGWLQ